MDSEIDVSFEKKLKDISENILGMALTVSPSSSNGDSKILPNNENVRRENINAEEAKLEETLQSISKNKKMLSKKNKYKKVDADQYLNITFKPSLNLKRLSEIDHLCITHDDNERQKASTEIKTPVPVKSVFSKKEIKSKITSYVDIGQRKLSETDINSSGVQFPFFCPVPIQTNVPKSENFLEEDISEYFEVLISSECENESELVVDNCNDSLKSQFLTETCGNSQFREMDSRQNIPRYQYNQTSPLQAVSTSQPTVSRMELKNDAIFSAPHGISYAASGNQLPSSSDWLALAGKELQDFKKFNPSVTQASSTFSTRNVSPQHVNQLSTCNVSNLQFQNYVSTSRLECRYRDSQLREKGLLNYSSTDQFIQNPRHFTEYVPNLSTVIPTEHKKDVAFSHSYNNCLSDSSNQLFHSSDRKFITSGTIQDQHCNRFIPSVTSPALTYSSPNTSLRNMNQRRWSYDPKLQFYNNLSPLSRVRYFNESASLQKMAQENLSQTNYPKNSNLVDSANFSENTKALLLKIDHIFENYAPLEIFENRQHFSEFRIESYDPSVSKASKGANEKKISDDRKFNTYASLHNGKAPRLNRYVQNHNQKIISCITNPLKRFRHFPKRIRCISKRHTPQSHFKDALLLNHPSNIDSCAKGLNGHLDLHGEKEVLPSANSSKAYSFLYEQHAPLKTENSKHSHLANSHYDDSTSTEEDAVEYFQSEKLKNIGVCRTSLPLPNDSENFIKETLTRSIDAKEVPQQQTGDNFHDSPNFSSLSIDELDLHILRFPDISKNSPCKPIPGKIIDSSKFKILNAIATQEFRKLMTRQISFPYNPERMKSEILRKLTEAIDGKNVS